MKRKHTIVIIVLMLCIGRNSYAQMHRPMRGPFMRGEGRERAHERIHAIKVAYITDKLHFTEEQSAKFWPIYDRYEQDVRDARHAFMEKYAKTNPGAADDATSRQYIDDNLDFQQKLLNIRRKYNDDFLKILSPQQVADLFKAEREFKQLLIQQLKQRRGGEWNGDRRDFSNDK